MKKESYFAVIVKDKKIVKIIPVSDSIDVNKIAKMSEYEDYIVYQVTKSNSSDILKVGDYAPNSTLGIGDAVLVKRNTSLENKRDKPEDYSQYVDNTDLCFSLAKDYVTNLTEDKIDEAKSVLTLESMQEEVYYRVFYRSFKAYRIQSSVVAMARALLKLVSIEPEENNYAMVEQMKKACFDSVLVSLIEKSIESGFTVERNVEKHWVEDMQANYSAYLLTSKALDFIIKFSASTLKKDNYLFKPTIFVDWVEAGSGQVWEPIGILRYNSDYKTKFLSLIK